MEVSEIIPYGPCHVNHPNPERARLLERIAKRMGLVHPCYWAGMLLADIDVVRDVCETVESSVANQIGAWDERMKDAVKACKSNISPLAFMTAVADTVQGHSPLESEPLLLQLWIQHHRILQSLLWRTLHPVENPLLGL